MALNQQPPLCICGGTAPIPTVNAAWTHIVMSASRMRQNVSFYANGQSIGEYTVPDFRLWPAVGPMYLGYSPLGGDEFLAEKIDDLRLYARALSDAEVRQLYDYESNLNLTNAAPVIIAQPRGQSVYAGDTAELQVVARGSWPLSYQWRKDGGTLNEKTNTTLILTNVSPTDTGDYTVVVTNAFGSVTSAVARFTVTTRPWPYVESLEGTVGHEWSNPKTDVTPIGNRRFLGQFGNDTVSLSLNSLPTHKAVTLSFDLFVINTWDGNDSNPGEGPDIWDLSVVGGPTLLHTTFQNYPRAGDPTQSFPDNYPGGNHPARTGAVENNTLGYINNGIPMDSVYHMSFTLPHTADSLTLNFTAQGLQGLDDESWGFDNVSVSLTPVDGDAYVHTDLLPEGTLTLTNLGAIGRVAASGTRALVTAGDSEVVLLDLNNPANPALLGSYRPLFTPSSIKLVGSMAYIASGRTGLPQHRGDRGLQQPGQACSEGLLRHGWLRSGTNRGRKHHLHCG